MADKLQTEITDVNEIYDIEPLIVPGVDWQFWFESIGWLLAGLLVLVVVLYLGSRWYRPLVLKWQLKALSKNLSMIKQSVTKPQVWKLYIWLKQFKSWIAISRKQQTALLESDLNTLMDHLNQAAFSKQPVSRETYLDLIQQAEQLLKQLSILPNLKAGTGKVQIEEERWKQ
ncbi:MAG: hypothetical protein U9R28_01340 [Pseudomonadota bacterium]|nr:hypothetical protein [Pseudomonadota bacterium]